jgi:hypothetical protein
MEGPMEQFFEVFNEVMVFITTATVLCFTDAYGNLTQKRDAGNFACGVIFVLIIVNLMGLFINAFLNLRKGIRRILNSIKRNRKPV